MTAAAPVAGARRPLKPHFFTRDLVWRGIRSVGLLVISVAVILLLWWGALTWAGVNSFVAKNPVDVLHYLFGGAVSGVEVTGSQAAANRREIWGALGTTAFDAVLGFVFGSVIAVLVAISVVVSRILERTFMPIAIALRSVPLVAMTPLIALVFGRGLVTVTVIAGIVTFFPTVVNMVVGLRSAPAQSMDVVVAYGGGPWMVLKKVALLGAMPSLFASFRIAAPLALLGATLAEWLATGKGLGALMLNSTTTSRYDTLWASVTVITVASIAVYAAIAMIESVVLRRFGQPTSIN